MKVIKKRKQEVMNRRDAPIMVKFLLRMFPRDVHGYAVQQKRGAYGLAYEITKTRNSAENALGHAFAPGEANRANQATIEAANETMKKTITRMIIVGTYHIVPQVRPRMQYYQNNISKVPAELFHIERSVLNEDVAADTNWTIALGVGI